MALSATVGDAAANSYVTQAEADTYFAAGMHPDNTTWAGLDSNDQDDVLIWATMVIDAQYINLPKYTTAETSGVPDQALKFPRTTDFDDSTKFIPANVKKATYEQAIWRALGKHSRAELQADGVRSKSIGDVSESYAPAQRSASALMALAPLAKHYLREYIRRSGAFS